MAGETPRGETGGNIEKLSDLEFKVSTLEKVNMDLLNELKTLKATKGDKSTFEFENKMEKLENVRNLNIT